MRMDKLTSRFQQAIADAQSLAVGRDHTIIEPAHLLLALLDQQGGGTRPLLAQAYAEAIMGVGVRRINDERFAAVLDGVVHAALLNEGGAEVAFGLGVVGQAGSRFFKR